MENGSVYYWKNYLGKEKEFDLKPDSYILHFVIVNQDSNDIYSEWFSFTNDMELIGFLRYVVLPSGYCSNLFGTKKGSIFIEAESYDKIMELLRSNTYKVDQELIDNIDEDYKILNYIENNGFSIDGVNMFCNSYNSHLNSQDIVWSYVEIFENISGVGIRLIKEYEEDGMIDELENQLEMSKEQIAEMFLNINKNPFMMKRIKELLNNTMGI